MEKFYCNKCKKEVVLKDGYCPKCGTNWDGITKKTNELNDIDSYENQSVITVNNTNTYLNNINTPKKVIGKCYLSPKCNNSQVFNNFYSINMGGNVNAPPFKVINVFKK